MIMHYIPLINLVCLVRTVSYGPSFSSPYGSSAKRAGHKKREKRVSITYGTDQAIEVNKMFIIWL